MHMSNNVHIRTCWPVMTLQQNVYDLLDDGAFNGDGEVLADKLVNSSLKQLGADTADAALYESMLLDTATVFNGHNPQAAVCAWRATDKHALSKLEQLLDCSLVKVVDESLWVHDVIKSIAIRKARSENKQCMTRVWLTDQVDSVIIKCYTCLLT
jgi:hypothetical protein